MITGTQGFVCDCEMDLLIRSIWVQNVFGRAYKFQVGPMYYVAKNRRYPDLWLLWKIVSLFVLCRRKQHENRFIYNIKK